MDRRHLTVFLQLIKILGMGAIGSFYVQKILYLRNQRRVNSGTVLNLCKSRRVI
jgi:hypothetical protein